MVIKLSCLVELRDISKIYAEGLQGCQALKDVSFCIDTGEILGIVGSSGSGKSTLMNIIGFLDRCSGGRYFFSGRDVTDISERELCIIRNQKIGFIFQAFHLLPRLSVLENVMLPLQYGNGEDRQIRNRAMAALESCGIKKFFRHKPSQLSGGQQQRVAISRALVNRPDLILADEPTGALDSRTGADVMSLLKTLNRRHNTTIVIVTHDKKISDHCRRIVTLTDGCVVT